MIFDVSTDRGIRTGNQMLTEILYRQLLGALGYARDLDLAELEITLESEGSLDRFKETYTELFQRDWDREKGKVAIALSQASRVMHTLDRPRSRAPIPGFRPRNPAPTSARTCWRNVARPSETAAVPRQVAAVRDRRSRPVRRPRRPEDARPPGDRPGPRAHRPRQALDRRDVAGEAQRAGRRPRGHAGRARPAHGPLSRRTCRSTWSRRISPR